MSEDPKTSQDPETSEDPKIAGEPTAPATATSSEEKTGPLQLIIQTFASPRRGLTAAITQQSFVPALILSTIVAVGVTATLAPRIDMGAVHLEALQKQDLDLTPKQMEEAAETSAKVGSIGMIVSSVLGPTIAALFVAFCMWLGFKVASGTATFVKSFSAVSYSLLPGSLAGLLALPAILSRKTIDLAAAENLLPSSLGALAPEDMHKSLVGLLSAVDLFSLWSLALLTIAMAVAASVSIKRSAVVTVTLWAAYVAVFKVALPALGAGAS